MKKDIKNSKSTGTTILETDGEAIYYQNVFTGEKCLEIFQKLFSEIDWQTDKFLMFGKKVETKRLVAWYAEENYDYKYAGAIKKAKIFLPVLRDIKNCVEKVTGEVYNSVLLNLYHNGDEAMSWHSDNEREIVKDSSIASVSFGADRKFKFKHKESGEVVDLILESGSLLDMRGPIQRFWKHCLPKSKKVSKPRINLTFRMIENL